MGIYKFVLSEVCIKFYKVYVIYYICMGTRNLPLSKENAKIRRNYGFNGYTIDNLKYLIEKGAASNETQIIELAVERLATEYRTREKIKNETPLQTQPGEDSLG